MDRMILSNNEQINASDMGNTNTFAMIGIAKLAAAVLGGNTLINDLMCIPDSPLSLNVVLQQGEIYEMDEIDDTPFGALPVNTNQILKTGISFSPQTIAITPPSSAGNSINYLIEVQIEDNDNTPENRPFFGSSPALVDTIRSCLINVVLKAGVPAPTGTQVTPTPDAGFIGAWVITVANGQTTITSGDISVYNTNNFINETLIQKISQATADTRYAQIGILQSGNYIYGIDSGTTNAIVASISPSISSLYVGMIVNINVLNTNTGACTLNLNGIGVNNILNMSGFPLSAGNLLAGTIAVIYWNGTDFILMNPLSIPVAFRASLSSNFSLPAGVATSIPFNTIETNINCNFNTSSGELTIQTAGIYKITGSIEINGDASGGGTVACVIYKNGIEVSRNSVSSYNVSATGFSENPIPEYIGTFNVGDTLQIFGFSDVNARTVFGNSTHRSSYFEGYRIF
jgi:hypothetical protein